MKQLDKYISEKLYINKDSKSEIIEYKVLTDKYSVGDKCLYISDSGTRSQKKVLIDVVQITRKTKTILEYNFITNISQKRKNDLIKLKPSDCSVKTDPTAKKYAFKSGMISTVIIIPREECIEILNKIKKAGNKFDLFDNLWNSGRTGDLDLINVMQLKDGTFGDKFIDYEDITNENLNKIEDNLK